MRLSISNIAWNRESDDYIYGLLRDAGIDGLEIAPTRIIEKDPYDSLEEAKIFAEKLFKDYSLHISSMQSIWFGRSEQIWGGTVERIKLIDYTKKAIDFAQYIGCKNLVFGCPKNRSIPENGDIEVGISFFKELGDYAYEHETCIGMEANPVIYKTNFLNNTEEAIKFIKRVDSNGFKLNLDIGTMVYNKEKLDVLFGFESLVNHVHISEPWLKPIERRALNNDIVRLLKDVSYNGYISVEMANTREIKDVENSIRYLRELA